jgi:hypothetical protein
VATIAVGDIHGHLEQLEDLLSRALPLVTAEDHLVFLGDHGVLSAVRFPDLLVLQSGHR